MNDILRAELTTDPLGLGYAAHIASGADSVLADLLNEVREGIQVARKVPLEDIVRLLSSTGEIVKIKESADSVAKSALYYFESPRVNDLDVVAAAEKITHLRDIGCIGQGTMDIIMAMGQRSGTRAEQLGLGYVDHTAVATALRG